jgi:hypothetical protein
MYKLMIVALLFALLGMFLVKGTSGRPFLSLDDFNLPADLINSLKGSPSDVPAGSMRSGAGSSATALKRVYKWQDDNGVWQFSDNEADAPGATLLELDGIINTIPAPPVVSTVVDDTVSETKAPPVTEHFNIPQAIIPQATIPQAMETLDKAREIQQSVNTRKAQIDQLISTEKP